MLPPRACVAAEQGLKEKYMKPATAATLAQGDIEVVLAVARAGRQRRRAKSWHEERRDNFLNGCIAEQHWAGKV